MDLQEEQNEILKVIDDTQRPGKIWAKYNGDVVCSTIAYYLSKHLPPNLRVFGPNAYVDGSPTEFDLLVGDAETMPLKFTNVYPPDQLRCLIEVKKRGVIGNKEEFITKVRKIHDNFQSVVKEYPNLKCAYIAIQEGSPVPKWTPIFNPKTMRFHQEIAPQTSIDYVKETRKALESFPFFALRNSRNKKPYEGQWEGFAKFVSLQDTKS